MKKRPLHQILRKEIEACAALFTELWPAYEEPMNTVAPHRQRTTVNKLSGFALFLGMPLAKGDPAAAPFRLVRTWQKRVGGLRDCDVMRDWVRRCAALAGDGAEAAAAAMDDFLVARRNALLETIRVDARGLPGAETRVALELVLSDFGRALHVLKVKPEDFDHRPALQVVAEPWTESLAILMGDQSDVLLHSFRVKNKRLRFVLELLVEAEGETELGAALSERAKVCAETHTALGNLSDLHVLRDMLRLRRARWAEEGRGLEQSCHALEQARASLEADNFDVWFGCWPKIVANDFLGGGLLE